MNVCNYLGRGYLANFCGTYPITTGAVIVVGTALASFGVAKVAGFAQPKISSLREPKTDLHNLIQSDIEVSVTPVDETLRKNIEICNNLVLAYFSIYSSPDFKERWAKLYDEKVTPEISDELIKRYFNYEAMVLGLNRRAYIEEKSASPEEKKRAIAALRGHGAKENHPMIPGIINEAFYTVI